MTGHDPLCPWQDGTWPHNRERCACGLIAKARADEQEKIAQALGETGHDPCCLYQGDGYEDSCEVCRTIEEARTDERERIALAIESVHDIWDATDYDRGRMDGLDHAARIAREGTP